MPASSKPRKPHRPRAIGRPVMERMRRELVLPAYLHLATLMHSADKAALEEAMSTIVTLINYMSRALAESRRDYEPLERAKDALRFIIARHDTKGVYRPTGEELQTLRNAVAHCDAELPYIHTGRLTEALLYVDRAMQQMGVET